MARYIKILMRANPFRGPLEGVRPENQEFLALKWQRAKRVTKKVSIFRVHPPQMALVMDLPLPGGEEYEVYLLRTAYPPHTPAVQSVFTSYCSPPPPSRSPLNNFL
jgi:hypothetical protein